MRAAAAAAVAADRRVPVSAHGMGAAAAAAIKAQLTRRVSVHDLNGALTASIAGARNLLEAPIKVPPTLPPPLFHCF